MKSGSIYILIVLVLLLSACNSTKYVPEGEFLLNKVKISVDSKEVSRTELEDYLRQTPNGSIAGTVRMGLGIYNLAPKDSSTKFKRFLSRTFKKIGDEPVIFSPSLTRLSTQQLEMALSNKGYIDAKATDEVETKGKKAKVKYNIRLNLPYRIGEYSIDLKNEVLYQIAADTSRTQIKTDMLFNVDILNAERERIASRIRQLGYYNFNKEFLSYVADSSLSSHKVDLTLELRDYLNRSSDTISNLLFKKYSIRNVIYYTNSTNSTIDNQVKIEKSDTVTFRKFKMIYQNKPVLKLDALVQNTYINPDTRYNDRSVEKTYTALNSLGPVKYANISFKEVADTLLDCIIIIVPSNTISVSTELEGTFTEGYWGVAGNLNYVDRNLFKGAETMTWQGRMALEKQDYIWAQELGAQFGLKFPRFMMPIGSYDFKRNIHANTEFTANFSYQNRPGEFITKSVGGGVNYSWDRTRYKHSFQLFDLNYVYFPVITQQFKDSFLNVVPPKFNPFNYEDHFIMRIGYSGSTSNFNPTRPLQNYSSSRYSIETAGNLLYGMSHLLGSEPDASGSYRLFNIRYSQYVKAEYNSTFHQILNKDNKIVFHLGAGAGLPYGNADVIPYEKRFYAGGANSVRGWSESTLGPGTYLNPSLSRLRSRDYNQVGDVKLDMSMEYRAKLVWLMEGALFLDAGNIWTIKNYETQKGGLFKLDTFLNEMAIAYGAGLRFDFSFFIARIDLGVKLKNPSLSRTQQWRVNPTISDDFALHFAIGYPF